RVTADRAEKIGLVEEVVAKGKALEAAMELAQRVASQSPKSVSACKTLIQGRRSQTHAAGLVSERELFLQLFNTQDQTEGVNAFLQKRKPQWTNS
ncbi:enoyl-CoA hydratase-related protein, partial [Vibrio parahaemolyticus]|nr:enoyl-CoA hydratase-related protein [Vibrio parahaemolyticus]